jgi:hypothetical protein
VLKKRFEVFRKVIDWKGGRFEKDIRPKFISSVFSVIRYTFEEITNAIRYQLYTS